ncbi:hypothetical protein [Micromonospora aurantiaca (nom. illeg.)]|uniref:hypothetical protein n=1 Tax=Micromonospora aurantiaca (nom. illeg.) TaxID=47850 RepID=UPI0011A45590|nr:hypothetical protein [Micromonospora aurantiaca]MBC9000540.1 hypothetical protein [Micromonospora aurantiaca]
MPKPQRPTISAPGGGSILDEVTAATAARPAGRPPFARDPQPDPEPAPTPAAETTEAKATAPAAAAPAAPRRRASAPPRLPAAPARSAPLPPAPGIPQPPPGYVDSTKPLQVYLPGGDHWLLKYGVLIRGTDMTSVVAALVSAYNHDPDAWHALIARADEERVPLGELLSPALAQAVEDAG